MGVGLGVGVGVAVGRGVGVGETEAVTGAGVGVERGVGVGDGPAKLCTEKLCGAAAACSPETLVVASCTMFSNEPALGKSEKVLVFACPSGVRTTASPSPTGREFPSVVVTTPCPVSETTVTCELAVSAPSAMIKVSPALTGETVPRGVTMTTED